MINDYECPRCHNVFPSSNKIMHDAKCTKENPFPLDASREKELNQKKEEIKSQEKKEQKDLPIKKPPSGEFPEVFECEICHQIFTVKERDDHMYCHKLEKEEKNKEDNFQVNPEEIERQKQIERQIERDKMRRDQNNNIRNNNVDNFIIPNVGVNDFDRGDPNINLGMGNFLNNFTNAISQQQMSSMNNYNNNGNNNSQNGGNTNSNMTVRFVTFGPNGQSRVQTFQSNGNNGNNGQNPSVNIFSSNNRRRGRHIPFMNFNQGIFDDIFEQFLQSMGNREHPTDEEILNELPETQIEDVTKLDPEKKNCIICLEDFKNGDKAIILPCIHIFHTECIKNWLKTQDTCPICKFKLTGENINSANGGNNM